MTEADFIASPRVLVRVALLDRDERCYAGHSLRCGGAAARALAGVAKRTSSVTAAGRRTPTKRTSSTCSARQCVSSLLTPLPSS